ncbi:MAG TPA: sulfurtransferase TusA family protein [Chloroflexota bacterium]|nr:sulfurtransferase TusA family protein [Chloroflexota bacterium]
MDSEHDERAPTIEASPAVNLAEAPMPAAMLEAGDAPWSVLRSLIARRMAELPSSAVLEVSFADPTMRLNIIQWCPSAGHDLFKMAADGDHTSFWIKKR